MPLHPPFWKPFKNMAAMSKVIRLSQKLRGLEPSVSTLCLGFVGRMLAEKVLCRMHTCQVLRFRRSHYGFLEKLKTTAVVRNDYGFTLGWDAFFW